MDQKIPNQEAARPHRRANRFRRITALLAIAVAASGMVLWHLARPAYRVYTSHPVGEGRTAVVVTYPSDWSVEDRRDSADAEDAAPTITWMYLRRARPQGPQRWLEHYFYHISEQDYSSSFIFVELQEVMRFRGLEAETNRLSQAFSTMETPGGRYSITRRMCPIGPCLDIVFQPDPGLPAANHPGRFGNVLLIFPTAAAGERQYEVVVRYHGNERLNGRLYNVASDVVSRLKLVREYGRPSP